MLLSGTLGTALTLPATGTKLLRPSIEIGFLVQTVFQHISTRESALSFPFFPFVSFNSGFHQLKWEDAEVTGILLMASLSRFRSLLGRAQIKDD